MPTADTLLIKHLASKAKNCNSIPKTSRLNENLIYTTSLLNENLIYTTSLLNENLIFKFAHSKQGRNR